MYLPINTSQPSTLSIADLLRIYFKRNEINFSHIPFGCDSKLKLWHKNRHIMVNGVLYEPNEVVEVDTNTSKMPHVKVLAQ